MKEIVFGICILCQYIYFKKMLENKRKECYYLKYSNDLLISANNKLKKENEKFFSKLFNSHNYDASDEDEDDDLIKII